MKAGPGIGAGGLYVGNIRRSGQHIAHLTTDHMTDAENKSQYCVSFFQNSPTKVQYFMQIHKTISNNLLIKYFFCTFAGNLCPNMKSNTPYMRIFNILLTVAAYGYLVYKLVTFPDYDLLINHFQSVEWSDYLFLIVCVVLMPLNIFFESAKWRELLRNIEPMTLCRAQQQVYFGFVGAFVTPYRAGDYPARATLLSNQSLWPSAIGLGLVGTMAMLIVQLIFGVPSIILFANNQVALPLTRVVVALVVLVLLIVFLPMLVRRLAHRQWKEEKLRQLFTSLADIHTQQFAKVLLWSTARYVVWGLQASAILAFCGVVLSPTEYLIAIPTYYLVLAFFPTLPLADIAIRGSWAMIIFGAFSANDAGIALAVTMVWIINTILPMLIGSIVNKSYRKNK